MGDLFNKWWTERQESHTPNQKWVGWWEIGDEGKGKGSKGRVRLGTALVWSRAGGDRHGRVLGANVFLGQIETSLIDREWY